MIVFVDKCKQNEEYKSPKASLFFFLLFYATIYIIIFTTDAIGLIAIFKVMESKKMSLPVLYSIIQSINFIFQFQAFSFVTFSKSSV